MANGQLGTLQSNMDVLAPVPKRPWSRKVPLLKSSPEEMSVPKCLLPKCHVPK